MHSQGGLQYFTTCFLCSKWSSHTKPPPSGNRNCGLQVFFSTSTVVILSSGHYFFLRALFPSPFFGFSFPRSFFNRLISSLKSWCSSLSGEEKKKLLYFLEYLDGKAPLNSMIMKKIYTNFLKQASPYWNTTQRTVLLPAVILTEIMWKNCSASFRTNKGALFNKKQGVCVSIFTPVHVCISYSVLTHSNTTENKKKRARMRFPLLASNPAV